MLENLNSQRGFIAITKSFHVKVLSKLIRALGKIVYILQKSEYQNDDEVSLVLQNNLQKPKQKHSRSILITTFEKRQWSSALPLVKAIRDSDVDLPIAVFVNGNLNKEHNTEERSNFFQALSCFPDVHIISSRVMTGISRNWNLGIQLLGTESVLCLSDDLEIGPNLRADLESAFNIAENEHLLVLGSFASFIITNKCIANIGWFDERFMGFGEEDGDYIYRFIEKYERSPRNYYTSSIRHLDLQTRGDDATGVGKYSLFNLAFRKIKYSYSQTGIKGMFDDLQATNLPSIEFHPMEKFRRINEGLLEEQDLESILNKIKGLA